MKIIQTFWSKPAKGNSLMDISAGWLSPEYHWISWTLSCLQAKKFYNDVELVTDERGKEILIDRLQLPYSSVNTNLEASLNAYPAELWSLAKIFSYSIQQQPFIHLDGDVFIWKSFDESFSASGLLAQNIEVDIPYYRSMLTDINKRLKYVPDLFVLADDVHPIYASNTGIFGGSNIAFIKEYCRQAFDFVDRNLHDISNFPAVKRPLLNFVFEQYLLFQLAASKHQDISYFMKEPVTDPAYRDYARLLDIPHVSLVHPVGAYKGRSFTCTQMAKRLRKEYPDHYYRIMDECKKEMRLVNKLYHVLEEPPADIMRLYKNDIHQYHLAASLFAGEVSLSTEICLNKDVVISDEVASLIEPEWMELNEMELSQLEMIIVSIAKDPITIDEILKQARAFFDEKEISQNPQSYIQLVTNSIKLLLYSRILNIS